MPNKFEQPGKPEEEELEGEQEDTREQSPIPEEPEQDTERVEALKIHLEHLLYPPEGNEELKDLIEREVYGGSEGAEKTEAVERMGYDSDYLIGQGKKIEDEFERLVMKGPRSRSPDEQVRFGQLLGLLNSGDRRRPYLTVGLMEEVSRQMRKLLETSLWGDEKRRRDILALHDIHVPPHDIEGFVKARNLNPEAPPLYIYDTDLNRDVIKEHQDDTIDLINPSKKPQYQFVSSLLEKETRI